MDDLRHDKRVNAGTLSEEEGKLEGTDRKFRDCTTTCEGRDYPPEYRAMMCSGCRKRESPAPETVAILQLKEAIDGGMPVAQGQIPYAVWQVLGKLRQRDAAEIGAMRGMFG